MNGQYTFKAKKRRKEMDLNQEIGIGSIWGKRDFMLKDDLSWCREGDGPFQIIEQINDNAYKVELLGKYSISATFNISNISLFDVGDNSRANIFEERANYVILTSTPRDPLEFSLGLVVKFRANRFKEANGLLEDTWAKVEFKRTSKNKEQALTNLIHVQERLVGEYSDITERLE